MTMRIFLKLLLHSPISFMLIFTVCDDSGLDLGGDNNDDSREPVAIFLKTDVDTLLLLANDTYTLSVKGIFTETSENTVNNSGLFAEANYTYITSDTTLEYITASSAEWYSSNSSVASVNNGTVTGIWGGSAAIWTTLGELTSDTVIFLITGQDLPPDLVIDPPPVQLIFQDSSNVSGRVTPGMDITLTVNGDTVYYDSDGRFSHGVHLSLGTNNFIVTATNNENGLTATASKEIIYYTLDTAGIEGTWEGETLTRPFEFEIYNSSGFYVIDGYLTINFTILGGPMVVENIVIAGLIRPDGMIDATASLESEGIVVSGFLEGFFLDSGNAEGSYGLSITKDGWPNASASATWWAERQ